VKVARSNPSDEEVIELAVMEESVEQEREEENQDARGSSFAGAQRRRGSRRQQGRRNHQRSFFSRKRCVFCEQKISQLDYKQVDWLRSFMTDRGKIRPRRQTGTCARHQRQLSVAIKRARHLALLPFVVKPGGDSR
jgi:small subunit ribosomal protein S18